MTNTTNAGDAVTRKESANEQLAPTGAKYRNRIKNCFLCLSLFFSIPFLVNAWEEDKKGMACIGAIVSSIAYSSLLTKKGSF